MLLINIMKKPVEKFHCVQPYQRLTFRNEFMYPCCVNFNKDLKWVQLELVQFMRHGTQKK